MVELAYDSALYFVEVQYMGVVKPCAGKMVLTLYSWGPDLFSGLSAAFRGSVTQKKKMILSKMGVFEVLF